MSGWVVERFPWRRNDRYTCYDLRFSSGRCGSRSTWSKPHVFPSIYFDDHYVVELSYRVVRR